MRAQPIAIAVLVSGGGTNLQALLDAQTQGRITRGRISLVISDRQGAYAIARAQQAGIEALTLERKGLAAQAWESALQQSLAQRQIGLIVLAGFLSILSADFTACWYQRIMNVHPSLIPSFCGKGYYGLRVHEAVLQKGVRVTGATVHYVNEEPDGGQIILQKAVRVLANDTPQTLQQRVMRQAEWRLLPRAVQMVCRQLQQAQRSAKDA